MAPYLRPGVTGHEVTRGYISLLFLSPLLISNTSSADSTYYFTLWNPSDAHLNRKTRQLGHLVPQDNIQNLFGERTFLSIFDR